MPDKVEGSVLTDKGLALIGKLLRGNTKLVFTRAVAGDGELADDMEPEKFTDVIRATKAFSITGVTSLGGEAVISLQMTSVGVATGFFIREAGIFAQDPDEGEILYAYVAIPEHSTWIRPEKHTINNLSMLYVAVVVDRVKNIAAHIDPAGLVTRRDLETRLAPLEANYELITIPHNLDLYPVPCVLPLQYGAGVGGSGTGPAGGTVPKSVPVTYAWPSRNAVTLYVPRPVSELGASPELHRLSDTTYTLTWPDNHVDSLFIQLQTDGQERAPKYKLMEITHGLGCYPIAAVAHLKYGAGMGGAGEAPAGGTPPKSIPVQWEWPSSSAITLFVPMDVARLGANLELHQIDSHQYTVTWADNDTDGLYIELFENVDMLRRHDTDMAGIRAQLAEKAAKSDLQAASGDISDILTQLEGMANVTDLEELRRLVAAKANQTDLQATNQVVAAKASQADLQAVRNTLAAKANQTDLQATNQAVAAKASQADLQAVRNTLTAKANQADLQATNQAVAAKADKTELNNYARVSSGVWTPVMYARLEPAGAPAVETVMPAQTNGVWHRVGRLVIAYFDVTLGNINGIQGAALMRGMPFERAGTAQHITLYGGLTHYSGWQSNNNVVGDGIPQVDFNPTSVTIAQFGLLLANGDHAMRPVQNLFTSNAKMSGCLIYITP